MEKKMKLVRLSSGEEIIGKVTETENSVIIENGYTLIPAGEGKIGFMPFMAYTKAKDGITIGNEFIMFIVEPIEDMVNQIRQMDSGIVVPDGKVLS
tara:strand:- start:4656 stop:4943 length:288 start_codon:yes stop_codon:yes gene_type:complete